MTVLQTLAPTRRDASPNQVLLIVSAGVVLSSIDVFIVNVALPQIASDLDASGIGALSWVLNTYAIVYASLLVFFGRLADRYRRDRAFLLGVAVFTLASAGCAASTSIEMLVAFRVVQAAGAALLTPTSLSLLLATFAPDKRAGAVRAWTALGGVAASLGPVVGGLLVTADWRWIFLVNLPIGVAAVIVGWRRLPEVPGHDIERPDPLGTILATVGIGALTLGLVEGGTWGWSSARLVVTLVIAAVLVAGFVVHTMVSTTPLVDPDLFRARTFTGASILAVFFSAGMGAMLLSIVLWEQDVWGWSALKAGLAIAPGPLMVPPVSFVAVGPLIARFGTAVVAAWGSIAFAVGVAWWAIAATTEPNYWSGIFGGMILTGIGVGLTLPTMMATASSALPPQSFATGSAVVNMIRQTALALGVAVAVAVLSTSTGTSDEIRDAFRTTWWITAAISLGGTIPALSILRTRQRKAPATSGTLGGHGSR